MALSKDNTFDARLRLVKFAKDQSIHAAARYFACSRNTVRRWLRRYEDQGPPGLANRSRAPHSCPHKTPKHQERRVVKAREQAPCFGPQRLKDLFGLAPSQGATGRHQTPL